MGNYPFYLLKKYIPRVLTQAPDGALPCFIISDMKAVETSD